LIARVRHTFETLIASWRAARDASTGDNSGNVPAAGASNHVHQEQAA
jgi:5-dehydro-2-deoxygluconokinase